MKFAVVTWALGVRAFFFTWRCFLKHLDRSQYLLDAQTKQINMGSRNSKSKNSDSEQVSQTEKPTLEEVFPIATNIQHSGYQLMLRKIFDYFKLENWLNWFYWFSLWPPSSTLWTCWWNREVWNSSIGFNLSLETHKRKKSQKRTKLNSQKSGF